MEKLMGILLMRWSLRLRISSEVVWVVTLSASLVFSSGIRIAQRKQHTVYATCRFYIPEEVTGNS
jgi:hypothetical protein